ncbi:MAG: sensor histidine kinase [Blautia sp.]|jgi:two-component system sensor histidine kinase AgrC
MFAVILNFIFSILEQLTTCLCLYFFMKHSLPEIHARKIWYPTAFTLYGIGSYVFTIIGQLYRFPWLGVIFMFSGIVIISWLLFHKTAWPIFFDMLFGVLLFLSMEIGIFLANEIRLLTQAIPAPWVGILAMGTKLILMILVTALSIFWLKQYQSSALSQRQAVSILILPIFSMFFFCSLMEMSLVYVQLKNFALLIVNLAALLLLNFYFLYLFGYLFRSNHLEQDLKLYQAQNELQYRYYEQLEQKYQESRKTIHDMKNHLMAVERLYQEDGKGPDAREYVQSLYHMLNILGEKYYTSNKMLNIIFNDKLTLAQSKGITVTAEIGDVDLSDLRDMDVTTIFANLLDNAIEAAQECSESPYIQIKLQQIQDFRVISIQNSREDGVVKKGHMGIGLKNVQQTLNAYSGTLHHEAIQNEYRVSIMLPKKEAL